MTSLLVPNAPSLLCWTPSIPSRMDVHPPGAQARADRVLLVTHAVPRLLAQDTSPTVALGTVAQSSSSGSGPLMLLLPQDGDVAQDSRGWSCTCVDALPPPPPPPHSPAWGCAVLPLLEDTHEVSLL